MSENAKTPPGYRAGFVALIGEPNAGKSTLLNVLLNEKVSIVSEKPQTTRQRVTGILSLPAAQLVFVDAPGMLKSTSGINRFLQDEAADVIESCDVICLLLSAEQDERSAEDLLATVQRSSKPLVVLITKYDLLGGTRTPRFFKQLIDTKISFLSISGLKRPEEAKVEVLSRVIPLLPESPSPLYDDDIYTTQTVRQMCAEFVREACFRNLRQEIPYGLAVRTSEFNEEGPVTRILVEIIVDKDNHKGIVIGAKGQSVKTIGIEARKQIEKLIGRQAHLEIHVQVKEGWTDNPRIMKELGYVISEK